MLFPSEFPFFRGRAINPHKRKPHGRQIPEIKPETEIAERRQVCRRQRAETKRNPGETNRRKENLNVFHFYWILFYGQRKQQPPQRSQKTQAGKAEARARREKVI
jgi:hypothetical protein